MLRSNLRSNQCLKSYMKVSSRNFFQQTAVFAAATARGTAKGQKTAFQRKIDPAAKKTKSNNGYPASWKEAVASADFAAKAPAETAVETRLSEKSLIPNVITSYPGESLKVLHHLGSFKRDQFNELFIKPISLITENTLSLKETFLSKFGQNLSSDKNRLCIIGPRGIGKTTLLTQAQSIAKSSYDAVVLSFNNPIKLVDGTNNFALNSEGLYNQPSFMKLWIDKIYRANDSALKKIKTQKSYKLKGGELAKGSPLYDFLTRTRNDIGDDNSYFRDFIFELKNQTTVPVLFTVDNINALTFHSPTRYMDQSVKPIPLEQFELGKLILDTVSGKSKFLNGGVILATSSAHASNDTIPVGLGIQEPKPYAKIHEIDWKLADRFEGVHPLEVQPLTKTNVTTLVKFYNDAKILRTDDIASEEDLQREIDGKYGLSGNGNPRDLLKVCTFTYY